MTTRTGSIAVAVLALVLALVGAPAAVYADDRSDAEALFRVGEKAFESTQYAAAADAFEQAYKKLPLPAIAFSLAQAHRLQYFIDNQPQHLERAVELYHAYIETQKTGGRVADAVANLAQVEPLLRELARSGATKTQALPPDKATRIVVTADIAGARATIDGDSGPVPFIRDVSEGEHAVTVSADGYVTQTHTATAIPGEMVPVEVELVAKPAVLAVKTPAGAYVSVDLHHVGEAPFANVEVPAGKHIVAIGERGHVPFVSEVELHRGATLSLDPALHTTAQRRASWFVLAGGGGLRDRDRRRRHPRARRRVRRERRSRDARRGQRAAVGRHELQPRPRVAHDARAHDEALGAAAGTVLVTGALLYLFDNPTPEAPMTIAPMVGSKNAGLVYGGRF